MACFQGRLRVSPFRAENFGFTQDKSMMVDDTFTLFFWSFVFPSTS